MPKVISAGNGERGRGSGPLGFAPGCPGSSGPRCLICALGSCLAWGGWGKVQSPPPCALSFLPHPEPLGLSAAARDTHLFCPGGAPPWGQTACPPWVQVLPPTPPLSCSTVGTGLPFLAGTTMIGEGGGARSPVGRPPTNSEP